MSDMCSAFGLSVQTPCGPRKSGMPESVEIPAPVSATTRVALPIISRARSSGVIKAFNAKAAKEKQRTPRLPIQKPLASLASLAVKLLNAVLLERLGIELEPMPRLVRNGQLAVHLMRRFLEELRRPRHVFHRKPVRHRR